MFSLSDVPDVPHNLLVTFREGSRFVLLGQDSVDDGKNVVPGVAGLAVESAAKLVLQNVQENASRFLKKYFALFHCLFKLLLYGVRLTLSCWAALGPPST